MEVSVAGLTGRGFAPRSIVDVDAAAGAWTRLALTHWPQAAYLPVEPLRERAPELQRLAEEHPRARCVNAAAGPAPGFLTLNVSTDLDGSSFLYERVDERPVKVVRLDDLVTEGLTRRRT